MRFGRKTTGRKRITLAHISFILACTVLITTSETFARPNVNTGQESASESPAPTSRQPTVALFRFAVQSETTDASAPSSRVCSQYLDDANARPGSAPADNLTVDPKVLDAISNELQQALSKRKMAVMVDADPDAIPVGSFVVCGRIFKVRKGSAVGRMFGLGMGASNLFAHVALLSKTESGLTSLDSFDLKLKGRNLFPPGASSAVIQAAVMEKRQNLQGLARKLADGVVKRLDGDLKQPRLTARESPPAAKDVSR